MERVVLVSPEECRTAFLEDSVARNRAVVRSTHFHQNGWYGEVLTYMLKIHATMLASLQDAPHLWNLSTPHLRSDNVSVGNNDKRTTLRETTSSPPLSGGVNGDFDVDDGRLGALLLKPSLQTLILDAQQQSGVNVEKGTADWRSAELDLFGAYGVLHFLRKGTPLEGKKGAPRTISEATRKKALARGKLTHWPKTRERGSSLAHATRLSRMPALTD